VSQQIRIGVLKETADQETRVALVPESVKKLIARKAALSIESGAGLHASISDDEYTMAGATVTADRTSVIEQANVLVSVNLPTDVDLNRLPPKASLLGFLRPLDDPCALKPAIERGLSVFAMELVPRITRAQAMDGLSSMATIIGYKAVLLAAERLPRMFPMLMTAAGTVPPARVLVLGAGVAGLQAIATARRLGAVVEGFDIRAAAGEAIRSLGATFLEVDLGGLQTEDAGGYAKEVTDEVMNRSRALIAKAAQNADCIITSAQVPGRSAPLLVTPEAVAGMKRGSVVVDLAGASGGNCALTKPDEEVHHNGVTILAPLNLAATVPTHASQLYSRNVTAFLQLLITAEGELYINLADDVVGPTCVSHDGKVLHPRVAAALSGQ
jgi:proton-translocating NAD(P)+ transhydrogenase subunit alpha